MTRANTRSLVAPWETALEFGEIRGPSEFGRDSFAAMPDQASSPRFPSRGVSHAFLDAVKEVALVAAGGDLDAARFVSLPRWNDAREPAGHGDLPSAGAVRLRMKVPQWGMALAVAFSEPEKRMQLLGGYKKRAGALGRGARVIDSELSPAELEELEDALRADDLFDDDELAPASDPGVTPEVAGQIIRRALQAVAYRAGCSPTTDIYDVTLAEMENYRAAAGLPPLGFPSSRTIIARHDSWAKALAGAGLEPPASYTRERALPLVEVLDVCIDEWGILPGSRRFRDWCDACGIPQRIIEGSWDPVVEEVRRVRAARGAETPEEVTRRASECPPLPDAEQAAAIRNRLGVAERYTKGHSVEDAYESLRIYAAEHVGEGECASRRHYMEACRNDKRLLWPTTLLTAAKTKSLTGLFREVGL